MKRTSATVLVLFTLSGVSGLIYEIVWIRLLSHLLGGTSFAISTVLAAFMGGLALGSRYFGDRADRSRGLLRLYAGLELGIAGLGAVAYAIIALAPPVYAAVASQLPPPLVAVLRVLIALLLLLPPTFLMGGTLPVLARYIVRRADRLGTGLGLLYAINTFGAVLGCFLAGFVLVPNFGVPGSVVLAVGLNAVIGVSVLGLTRRDETPEAASDTPAIPVADDASPVADAPDRIPYLLVATVFALSGFASLGYELYWTRGLQPFLGNSTYAFSAMLTTFLAGLSAGGWLGGRLADRTRRPAALLGWTQLGVGAAALATLALIWGWLPGLGESDVLNRSTLGWSAYLARRFAVTFGVMAVPTLLIGMTFPIVNRVGITGLDRLGGGVGRLYFFNTLGSIAGSLIAGFVLLPLLTARGALAATALLNVALGLALHAAIWRRDVKAFSGAVVVATVLVAASVSLWNFGRAPFSDTQDPIDRVLFDREDHAGHTRVYRKPNGVLHMSVDGFHIGGTDLSIVGKEKILAHLPLALNPAAKHTLSVGLGSGITLGSLASYRSLERIDCVEIVPGVAEGAAFFSAANHDVLDDPRVHLHVGDGVQFLLTTPDRFDVISSDSKLNPEFAGNGPLLSRDYYELCRDRLAPGGVMVQWLACHLPIAELEVIARSFAAAFDHVAVFWLAPANLVLAGGNDPIVLDLDAVSRAARGAGSGPDLAQLHLADPYMMAGLYLADRDRLIATLGEGPQNTWARPRVEFTLLREYRTKSSAHHSEDVLRWQKRLRDPSTLALRGAVDTDRLALFQESARATLDGLAVVGGVERVGGGLAVWQEALEKNPDDDLLSFLVACEIESTHRLEQAGDEQEMNDPNTMTLLAVSYLDQKRYAEALDILDRAIVQWPDSRSIRMNRLLALRGLGRSDEAATELAEFRRRFPDDAAGFNLAGRSAAENGRLDEAVSLFREATRIAPLDPVYWSNLAAACVQTKSYAEAAEAFASVAGIQADFPKAALHAAACYSLAGRTDRSAEWMRFCLEHDLETREVFETHDWFENLRNSPDWP